MKSVGETMAIAGLSRKPCTRLCGLWRSAIRSSWRFSESQEHLLDLRDLEQGLLNPNSKRLFYIAEAFNREIPLDRVYELTRVDPWFLHHVRQIVEMRARLMEMAKQGLPPRAGTRTF